MTAEDEFRKVGEDMRELARALRSELRAARQRAREQARDMQGRPSNWYPPPWDHGRHGTGAPRWDRYRQPYDPTRWWAPPPAPGGPDPSGGPSSGGPDPFAGGPDARFDVGGERGRSGVAAPPAWGPVPPSHWSPRPPRQRRRRARPERPPVRHRRDGSTLISVLLVLVGLAWLGSQSGIFPISTEAVLAVVLALIGAAMVLTARTDWALSRRAWPVLVGAAVILMLVVNTNGGTIQDRLSSLQFGPQQRTITSWADASVPINNFAGPVTVDLVSLAPQPTDADETLRINATAGPIDLTVPDHPGYHLHIRAQSAFAPVNIRSTQAHSGPFADRVVDYSAGLRPMLDVEITSRAGPITVRTVGTP